MNRFKHLGRELQGMFSIFAAMLIPFAFLLVFIDMYIETSLLRRKIEVAAGEYRDLEKKNNALRGAIAEGSSDEEVQMLYWRRYGALPYSEHNRVVTVRMETSNHQPR